MYGTWRETESTQPSPSPGPDEQDSVQQASCLLQTVPASFPAPFSSTPFVSSYWPPCLRARYGPHVAASFLPSPVVVCCSVACCISRASPCHCPSTTSHPPHPTPQGSVSRSSCLPLKPACPYLRSLAREHGTSSATVGLHVVGAGLRNSQGCGSAVGVADEEQERRRGSFRRLQPRGRGKAHRRPATRSRRRL